MKQIIKEVLMVMRLLLQVAMYASNIAAQWMAMGIIVRWSLWLQALGIACIVQATVEALFFEGMSCLARGQMNYSIPSRTALRSQEITYSTESATNINPTKGRG